VLQEQHFELSHKDTASRTIPNQLLQENHISSTSHVEIISLNIEFFFYFIEGSVELSNSKFGDFFRRYYELPNRDRRI